MTEFPTRRGSPDSEKKVRDAINAKCRETKHAKKRKESHTVTKNAETNEG